MELGSRSLALVSASSRGIQSICQSATRISFEVTYLVGCCGLRLNDCAGTVIVDYHFYYLQKNNKVQYLLNKNFLSLKIEEKC